MSQNVPPLPPGDTPAIFVRGPAGQVGPMTGQQLLQQIVQGSMPDSVAIWYQGMPDWIAASGHPAFAALIAQHRPPGGDPYAAARAADDEHDRVFAGLVKASWDWYNENLFSSQIDEVLLGAIITCTLDNGFSLIDLRSDGGYHFLRFENMQTHARIVVQVKHLTSGLMASKVLGQRASVVIGYGERVQDFQRIWQAIKAEYKSGYIQSPEPGTISVDADVASGYVYVQIDMYWNIEEYVKPDYNIDYGLLTKHIGATVHALGKYLRGRLG